MTPEPAGRGDPRFEAYGHVADHVWLKAQGLFVAEGRLVVQRAIASRRYRLQSVLVTAAAAAALGPETLEQADAPVLVCGADVLRAVTGFDFHRGCLALVERPVPEDISTLVRTPGRAPLVGLDGIGNPDNTGGIFRSAAAFGAAGVLVGPGTSDPFYRKSLRTSMGAVLDVPWSLAESWPQAFAAARAAGFMIAALTPSAAASAFDALAAAGGRVLLMLGSEGEGLGPDLLAQADVRVRIPISGRVDSLNVSVAAGIALHLVASSLRDPGPA